MPDPMKIDIKIEKEEASRSIDQLFSKLKSIGEPVKAIKSVLEKLGMDTVFNTANKVITEPIRASSSAIMTLACKSCWYFIFV